MQIGFVFVDPERLPGVHQFDGYVDVVRPFIGDSSGFHEAFLGFNVGRIQEAVFDEFLKAWCHNGWRRWAVGDRTHGLNVVIDDYELIGRRLACWSRHL